MCIRDRINVEEGTARCIVQFYYIGDSQRLTVRPKRSTAEFVPGGVGKSLVTSSLAVAMRRMGKKVGVLDADITGPSIPTAFGVHTKAEGSELGIYPAETKTGIEIMSLNLLTENETDPVVWRGPVIAGAVKQFWTDVIWGDVDYLFVDMPPGTGDVPLTVFLKGNGLVVKLSIFISLTA